MIYDRVGLRMASEGLWEAWETLEERVVGCRRAWNGSGFRKGLRRNALCSSEIVYCVIHSSGRKCNNWQHENRQQYKAIMNLKINSNKLNRQEKSVNRRQASERQLRTCMKKLWFEKKFRKNNFWSWNVLHGLIGSEITSNIFRVNVNNVDSTSASFGARRGPTSSNFLKQNWAFSGPEWAWCVFLQFFSKIENLFF